MTDAPGEQRCFPACFDDDRCSYPKCKAGEGEVSEIEMVPAYKLILTEARLRAVEAERDEVERQTVLKLAGYQIQDLEKARADAQRLTAELKAARETTYQYQQHWLGAIEEGQRLTAEVQALTEERNRLRTPENFPEALTADHIREQAQEIARLTAEVARLQYLADLNEGAYTQARHENSELLTRERALVEALTRAKTYLRNWYGGAVSSLKRDEYIADIDATLTPKEEN